MEHFIFVVAFTQIGEKQAHDESRSQFAAFATWRTSFIPYGQNRSKANICSFVLFFNPLSTILPFIRTTGKRIKATRLSGVSGIYR